MELILIAAVSENRVIGKDGQVPWHIPEDMQRFKQLTLNHPVIMGRKTYESFPTRYRPLPERWNIVLTRQQEFHPFGISVASSLEEAIQLVQKRLPRREGDEHIQRNTAYVIGGQSVYEAALPLAQRLEITHVCQTVEDGNAFFPEINQELWLPINQIDREGYAFVTYTRR